MTEVDLQTMQKEADRIDRELSQELEKNNGRVKRLSTHRAFPKGSWIITVAIFLAWMFGGIAADMVPYEQYKFYIFLFGCLSAIFSAFFTVLWLKSKAFDGKGKMKPLDETPKAIELRAKRDALRNRIAEYKKEHRV